MRFQSERLIYREFTEKDFHLFYSIFSNEHVMKYALMDQCKSEEEIRPYFMKVIENNNMVEDRKVYEFAVFLSSDHSFIGFADIEIHLLNIAGGCGEIGYFINPDFWGSGYATEVANSLTEFCFKYIDLHRVTARCNSNNLRSEKVMIKIGMLKEGEFRKARYKNGHWENEKHYSILANEWNDRKNISEITD